MNTISTNAKSSVEFKIKIEMTVSEAKALKAITEYGSDEFLSMFYKNLGKVNLQPYEKELKSLFLNIRQSLPNEISKIEKAKKAINDVMEDFK